VTDEEGKFVLEGLDPELLFELLVYERRHAPTTTGGYVDPRFWEERVVVERNDLDRRSPGRVLRGRVVDAHGRPIARATIAPQGRAIENGHMFGAIDGLDVLALTDDEGRFALGVPEAGDQVLSLVEASAFAPRVTGWLEAGPEEHEIVLGRGVTVTGLLQEGGKPLAGVGIGLAPVDRSAEGYLGEKEIATNEAGRFTFVNVAGNASWWLLGTMSSLAPRALASRSLALGADGTTVDVGVLEVGPGLTLTGRVELADGRPIPEGCRVMLIRDEVQDSAIVELGADGAFRFEGLPAELYDLTARVPGYHVSPENESLDPLNVRSLMGRVDEDVSNLVLLLDTGPPPDPDFSQEAGERYMELQESPLRGLPPDDR
jgi:hypothetical protein